ncbi:hypothetical protein ACFOD4_04900 [Pseudoroseomonas globiformis]|uniref:Uncharacterized protein n=1 Tax=Teichococcus globiformis TaxID=2307229 RepID=A0ABV7G249_9PROT
MLKTPTVADLLLMPTQRTLSRRGVQSALEQFMRAYSFDLFTRMADFQSMNDAEYTQILAECAAEALSEVTEETGRHQGIYRFLYQDEVIGFVRMRLHADRRCPEPTTSDGLVAFHVDAVLSRLLARRISQSLPVIEDRPERTIDTPVGDFLAAGCERDFTSAVDSISDASLRRLLALDLLPRR